MTSKPQDPISEARFLLKHAVCGNDTIVARSIDHFNLLAQINDEEHNGRVDIVLVDDLSDDKEFDLPAYG